MYKHAGKLLFLIVSCFTFNSSIAQSFNGKTQWSNTFDMSSYVSSSVKSIDVIEGQKISVGDQLLSMDDTRLKLDHKIAQSKLAALEPIKEKFEMDFNRALELYDRTLISDVTLKTAEFEFTEVKAKYDIAFAELGKVAFFLESATIRSPINGRVLKINTSVGVYSDKEKAKSLIILVDDSKMYAVANLKVSQWNQALVGKSATVIINKKRHKGSVKSLSLLPVDRDDGLSVYPIIVEFDIKTLYPEGMPLTINIK